MKTTYYFISIKYLEHSNIFSVSKILAVDYADIKLHYGFLDNVLQCATRIDECQILYIFTP
jgi:hypothetical protein